MADYNSSLPVIGSQAITNVVTVTGSVYQSTDPWNVLGSINVENTVAVSGNLGVEFTSADYLSVVQSGTEWLVGGSVDIRNFTDLGSSRVVIGSVEITNTTAIPISGMVTTNEGARSTTIQDYDTAADVAAGGSDVHWYETTGTFNFGKASAGFSGKGKISVGYGSPTITKLWTGFNSTAFPNVEMDFGLNSFSRNTGSHITVIRYNRESTEAQDVYSTIIGFNS